jgi:IS30 family transposase
VTSKQSKINDRVSISERPSFADDSRSLYHFEGNTIVDKEALTLRTYLINILGNFKIT